MRDPLEDPRPLDMVRKGKRQRTVCARRGNEIVYTSGKTGRKTSCWLTTWQDWCRSAEVVAFGEAKASKATHPTAADVIAEAKKALEKAQHQLLVHHDVSWKLRPAAPWAFGECGECSDSKIFDVISECVDLIAAWEAAQR